MPLNRLLFKKTAISKNTNFIQKPPQRGFFCQYPFSEAQSANKNIKIKDFFINHSPLLFCSDIIVKCNLTFLSLVGMSLVYFPSF